MSVDDKAEIMHLMELMRETVETGDFKSRYDLFTEDFNGFGSNFDEFFINKNELMVDLDKQSNQQNAENIKIKFVLDNRIVNLINHSTAFGMSYGTETLTYPEGELNLETRVTTIFKKINDHWKVCHLHLSHPFTASEAGSPYPKYKQISENITNWLKRLEIDTFDEKDQNKRKGLIEYLQKAKALLDA